MFAPNVRGAPALVGALARAPAAARARRCRTRVLCATSAASPLPSPALPPDAAAPGSDFVIRNARRVVEPPLGDGFCYACRGTAGVVVCADCGGRGVMARGGYTRSNPVNLKQVVGSKWTAHERTFGWKHFVVRERRKEGAANYVEMQSTCDESVRFWVNVANLKDRERWSCGWLERAEMTVVGEAGGALKGNRCRACSGTGSCRCPACTAPGGVLEVR